MRSTRSIEQKGRVRAQKRNFKKALLSIVATAGVISVALVAPNVLGAMRKIGIPLQSSDSSAVARARRRLVAQGLLVYEGSRLRVTPKGESALRMFRLKDYATKRPQRWDGRWRVLIFDIPEHRKVLRDKVRHSLREIGFQRLQDSVWIYPYDCEDFITLLKADFKVGKDVLYMIVDELEYDAPVKKLFGFK